MTEAAPETGDKEIHDEAVTGKGTESRSVPGSGQEDTATTTIADATKSTETRNSETINDRAATDIDGSSTGGDHTSERDHEGEGDAEGDEDADDASEEEDEEDEDEEDEDDSDDEDEEPKLKYARLTSHLGAVYRNGDATSSFVVAGDKMVRLTNEFMLHLD
jgi:hypothetical protein